VKTYPNPPLMPTPVDRAELGRNQAAYLHYFNTAFRVIYNFTHWLVGFIPWLSTLKGDMSSYLTTTLNAKDSAITARNEAVSARNEIMGYVIPTQVTISEQILNARLEKVLNEIMDNRLIAENNFREIQLLWRK